MKLSPIWGCIDFKPFYTSDWSQSRKFKIWDRSDQWLLTYSTYTYTLIVFLVFGKDMTSTCWNSPLYYFEFVVISSIWYFEAIFWCGHLHLKPLYTSKLVHLSLNLGNIRPVVAVPLLIVCLRLSSIEGRLHKKNFKS